MAAKQACSDFNTRSVSQKIKRPNYGCRLVMGSDAEYVVRITPVPVLLVRGTKAKD
jgi:hypothetical protein